MLHQETMPKLDDIATNIEKAEMIFMAVNTPTKTSKYATF